MPLFKLSGGGTVTSVGLMAPGSVLAVTGSPVTTAGVLALALVTQAANFVWAGPTAGSAANPTFRALVAADLPGTGFGVAPSKIVFDGDSLTDPAGIPPNTPTTTWPYRLYTDFPWAAAASEWNYAVAGDKIANVTARYMSSVYPHRPTSSSDQSILFVWVGLNDIGTGSTAAAAYAALKSYWATAKSDGFTLVAFTITTTKFFTQAQIDIQKDLNNMIRSDPTLYDFLIEPDTCFPSPRDASQFGDGVHFTILANTLFAREVNRVLWRNQIALATPQAAQTNNEYLVNFENLIARVGGIKTDLYIGDGATNYSLANRCVTLECGVGGFVDYELAVAGVLQGRIAASATAMAVGTLTSIPLLFATAGVTAATLATTGALRLHAYAAGFLQSDASGNVTSAAIGAVTSSGITMSTARILGRMTAGAGAVEELTVGTSLALSGGAVDAIQGIRTADSPQFSNLPIGGALFALSPSINAAVTINAPSGGYGGYEIAVNGILTARVVASSAAFAISALTSIPLQLGTAGVTALTLDASQNAIFVGSVKTANPSGGTAQPVKFGSYVAGAPAATGYQQIDINGVAYKVLAST